MAYFKDLTPYEYYGYNEKILNVGWLDSPEFSKGKVSDEVITVLKSHLKHKRQQMRGWHICPFCTPEEREKYKDSNSSSNEIWIIGPGYKVYACPSLIIHYIEAHNYLPPEEFIIATLNCVKPGTTEYEKIIKAIEAYFVSNPRSNEDIKNEVEQVMIGEISKVVDEHIIANLLNAKTSYPSTPEEPQFYAEQLQMEIHKIYIERTKGKPGYFVWNQPDYGSSGGYWKYVCEFNPFGFKGDLKSIKEQVTNYDFMRIRRTL